MKKFLFFLIAAVILLAAGLLGYRALQRTDSGGTKVPNSTATSEPAKPVVSTASEEPATVVPRMAVAKKAVIQPEEILQVAISPDSRFQPIDEARIVDQRITTVSKDRKKRELLVKADGKYTFYRVEETLVRADGSEDWSISSRTEMVADHVLVKLQDGQTKDDLLAMLKNSGGSILRQLSMPGHYIVQMDAPTLDAVPEAVSAFSAQSNVLAYAEPDYFSHVNTVPNDTQWSDLWGMVKINATGAWDVATGSTNVVVAVVDTGITLTHPDLISNLWINVSEVNGAAGVDDDGNGYIDDTNGWNFASTNSVVPDDDHGHGTHCAGTIGAVGNNAKGIAGVCWVVKLMALKAGNSNGVFAVSDSAEAVQYAADNGANIVSASYGGSSYSDTARDAIVYANSKGVLFIAAAGNDSENNDTTPVYPACYDVPNIVAVAATDQNDALASFSNYGQTSVDLAAPGVDVLSTFLGGTYDSDSGTSMATPHVAGAAALMLSANPSLTHLQIKEALLSTVDPVGALASKTVSGGRLNVQTLIALQDTDGDGMPDDWETANGLNPTNSADALLDPDADHLNNLGEYENHCITTNADTDGDTLVDGWEVTYSFNPNSTTGSLTSTTSLGDFSVSGDSKNIVVDGSYAYVAAGSSGLVILNISDPRYPVQAGSYDTGTANDIAVTNGYAYVADGENGLVIVDVSTPSSLSVSGTYNTNDVQGVFVQSNHAYIVTGTSADLLAIDVSNPSLPVKDGYNDFEMRAMNDIFVQGGFAYVSMDGDVKRYNLSTSIFTNDAAHYEGISLQGLDVTGVHGNSSIIAAAAESRVEIMDTSLVALGNFDTDGTALGVFVSGNYVYVADGTNGLVVLDISNPASPFETIHLQTTGSAVGVFVSNGYTYVVEEDYGMEVFSILFDADSDGMLDSWEMIYFGDLSRDGTLDFDNDGISDWGEYLADLDPKDDDQDGDELIDGTDEVITYNTDPRTFDTDSDGLVDGYDGFVSTNTYAVGVDVNTNGFVDGELDVGTTNTLFDTDTDGMSDGWEVRYGLNPLVDDASGDADVDGLSNLGEYQNGTNPNNPDTDGDGMPDGWEVDSGLDPLVADADGDPDLDGLKNLQEYSLDSNSLWQVVYTNITGTVSNFSFGIPGFTDPKDSDSDDDGLSDFYEITTNAAITNLYITNPNSTDTDADGMPDGWEVDSSLNPLVDDAAGNPDGDGLNNLQEYLIGTDPQKADTDDDGLNDDVEISLGTDPLNGIDPVFVDDDALNDPSPNDSDVYDPLADGTIIHPFDAIQTAIDAATNGVTILITNGLYFGAGNYDLDTNGKEVTIRSWNGPAVTIINSDKAGSVFDISSGEGTNTAIQGLSLTSYGGEQSAVVLDGVSIRLENCWIYDSMASGIECLNSAAPLISTCSVYSVSNGIYSTSGAGLAVQNSTVSNCTGRGIWIQNDPSPQILDSTVENCAGGIRLDASHGLVERCVIRDNTAESANTDNANGAGILLLGGSSPRLVNLLVTGNSTTATGVGFGLGGGISVGANSSPTIINCTVADNSAVSGGGIATEGRPVLRNVIIWTNTASAADDSIYKVENTPDVTYCCIDGGYPSVAFPLHGVTNNPLFVGSGDYHLSTSNSPCVDTGTLYLAPTNDLDGLSRSAALPSEVDMGCYEFSGISVIDSDLDGLPDAWETAHSLNPNDDTGDNGALGDPDIDGLTNLQEYTLGTDPQNDDTDGDGMLDGWEVANGFDPLVNDSARDTDSDGLTDYYEMTTNAEITNLYITLPDNSDTDGDGMPDGWENLYAWPTNALSPLSTNGYHGADGDPDSDGLSNLNEYLYGTNPRIPDTDGDGMNDGDEVDLGTDPLNGYDPVYVDDDAAGDPEPGNPNVSNTNENGTLLLPFDSIQKAIDSTNTVSGMTIFVTNGLYEGAGNYDINPQGKNLKILASETNVVIKTHEFGAGFIIENGETTNTVISGFTIETDGALFPEEGIVVDGSSPVITNCIIHNCELEAVSCLNGAAPQILNSRFYDVPNGLYADGSAGVLLQGCVISNTTGRGIVIMNDDLAEVTWSTVENCAGGITLDNSDAQIRQCIIRNNEALNYYTILGVPISEPVQFDLLNSDAADTTSSDENGAGILILNGSSPLLRNCLIAGNTTWADDPAYSDTAAEPAFGLGAGIYVGSECSPTGVNCTVVNNHANTRGGGLSSAGRPLFRNMIFWDNTSSNATIVSAVRTMSVVDPNIQLADEVVNIWYSDIQYGYSNAVLCITNNPLFVSGTDYTLQAGSPCTNSGTYYLAPLVDLNGDLRPTVWPDRVDMGCYEYGTSAATNPIALGSEIAQEEPSANLLADTDGDGFSNGAEMMAGTDMEDSSDYFHVTYQQSQVDGSVLIAWQSIADSYYTVQSTDSLTGTWIDEPLCTNQAGTGGIMTFSAELPSGTRYYRVLVYQP